MRRWFPRQRWSRPLTLGAALGLAGLAACGSPVAPVAQVEAASSLVSLPHAGWERLALRWRMVAPVDGVEGELRVLLHLEDDGGELLRTFDHPFPGGWVVGEERSYEVPLFQSALATPLELGDYRLEVGLYDAAGQRWAVAAQAGGRGDRSQVATVRAVAPPAGFPELSFSAEWLPTEDGEDRQILARRWLAGEGAIRVRGIERAGSLWLRVGIPGAGERQELVLGEGAAQPAATVVAECSGFEAELSGRGSHTLAVPLAPGDGAPGECRILFTANYELTSVENREKRTVALENVAWRYDG